MLIQCVECQREISDQAAACPHCGYPVKPVAAAATPSSDDPPYRVPEKKARAKPIFLALAVIAVIVAEGTPRLLIFFPVMCILGFSIVSLIRGERWSGWAWLTLVLGFVTWGLSGSDFARVAGQKQAIESAEQSARIVSSRWVKDPNFGTRGTIKWYVEVENISQRYIKSAEVEFTTYDAAGKIVATTRTFVNAIPPGGRSSDNSYADFYRTESTAEFRLKRVRFE